MSPRLFFPYLSFLEKDEQEQESKEGGAAFLRKMNKAGDAHPSLLPLARRTSTTQRGRKSRVVKVLKFGMLCLVIFIAGILLGSSSNNNGKTLSSTSSLHAASIVSAKQQSSSRLGDWHINTSTRIDALTNNDSNQHEGRPTTCTWSPGKHDECRRAIQALVCRNHHDADTDKIPRLVAFGDSTMKRLFGSMRQHYATHDHARRIGQDEWGFANCTVLDYKERCRLNEQFGLLYPPNQTWTPPVTTTTTTTMTNTATNQSSSQRNGQGEITTVWMEGPVTFGLRNPFCQDCSGCYPTALVCHPFVNATATNHTVWHHNAPMSLLQPHKRKELVYGGFLGVEFARDVEIQTPQYGTTQENMAAYVTQQWNDPRLLQHWQKPICLVNTAHHDVLIPGITQTAYLANVQWYLHLLATGPCRHILWLATTTPRDDSFQQTVNVTRSWGRGVRTLLQNDPLLHTKSLYIDVFEASRSFPHMDNLHMETDWYNSLASLFEPETFLDCSVANEDKNKRE